MNANRILLFQLSMISLHYQLLEQNRSTCECLEIMLIFYPSRMTTTHKRMENLLLTLCCFYVQDPLLFTINFDVYTKILQTYGGICMRFYQLESMFNKLFFQQQVYFKRNQLYINKRKISTNNYYNHTMKKQQAMWNHNNKFLQKQQLCRIPYKGLITYQQQQQILHAQQNPLRFVLQNSQNQERKVKQQNYQQINEQPYLSGHQSRFSSSEGQDSRQLSSQEGNDKSKKKAKKITIKKDTYRKYSRITPEIRQRLIYLIARQNMSIKDASIQLKINYSSAKFIFSQYRDKKLHILDKEIERDQTIKNQIYLKRIENNQNQTINSKLNKILVKCSSGGKFEIETQKLYTLKQICEMYRYPYSTNYQAENGKQ